MQFHKRIKPDNPPIPNNGVHHWLWTGFENKIKIEKYIDKLLFSDFIHTSKIGIVNTLMKGEKLISEEELQQIQRLFDQNIIDARLKNIFESLSNAECALKPEDKERIDQLCKNKQISKDLRDICLALYGSQMLIPDLTASQIQKLYEKEFLNDKIFVNEGLKCCRDLLFNLGYQDILICDSITVQDDGLKTVVNEKGVKNLMIIPGCQHDGMLSGRVLKAVRLLDNFQTNLTIYASGDSPLRNQTEPEKVSISEEGKFICSLFNDLVLKMNVNKPPIFKIIPELDSYDSHSNLENCLKNIDDQPHNLIIVSSTFDLIKLAKSVERLLTKNFDAQPKKIDHIKNIILVGAEGVDAKFTPTKSGGYIKSMFIEVYSELLIYKENLKRGAVLKQYLDMMGYMVVGKNQPLKLYEIINLLGVVIQTKDVAVQEQPKKDSDSARSMELHTDHPSADYVILECIRPSSEGGISHISDIFSVYRDLHPWLDIPLILTT
jgi:hypothetical protein